MNIEGEIIHVHQIYCDFKSFYKVNFLSSFPKLLFRFLWTPCLHSGDQSCCFLQVPFQRAALANFHPNICKSHQGKMGLTQVTVLSFHGYCSGSRCCLWAKSLEIIMTSALLLQICLCPHRKQGERWVLGCKVTLRKATFLALLKY